MTFSSVKCLQITAFTTYFLQFSTHTVAVCIRTLGNSSLHPRSGHCSPHHLLSPGSMHAGGPTLLAEPFWSKLYIEACWVPAEGGLPAPRSSSIYGGVPKSSACPTVCVSAHQPQLACSSKNSTWRSTDCGPVHWQPNELLCRPGGWNYIFWWEPALPRCLPYPWTHSLRILWPFRVCGLPFLF